MNKENVCERCGYHNPQGEHLVEYGPYLDGTIGGVACEVCNRKLEKMLFGLRVEGRTDDEETIDYERRFRSIVDAWKERPLSRKEKIEISKMRGE
jgi:hypothetical protein